MQTHSVHLYTTPHPNTLTTMMSHHHIFCSTLLPNQNDRLFDLYSPYMWVSPLSTTLSRVRRLEASPWAKTMAYCRERYGSSPKGNTRVSALAQTYGSISSVNMLGQIMVILHDREAVHELMEKKSIKTSGRPWLEFAYNMCGFGRFVLLQQYDDVLRKYRRYMHQQFGTKTLVAQYHDIQKAEAAHLLVRVLETPQDLMQHFKT